MGVYINIDVKEIKRGAVAILNIDDVAFFVSGEGIIAVPDHGDLIDRDAVKPKDCYGCPYNECYAHDLLNDSPVVIPAESGLSPVMPITNADRIRQMSDDELATLFGDACACLYDDADVCEKWGGACDRCWLDWLKQEAERSENGEA